MYRFKAFDSAQCGDVVSHLEAQVNAWMEEERPRICHMCQSVRGEHILLCFVYENAYELEQRISSHVQKSTARSLSHLFEHNVLDDPPTSPRIPATPPPIQ